MGWSDTLREMVEKFTGGNTSDSDVHSTYEKVAGEVPEGTLSDGIAHVFKSDQTPPFDQMVGGLFNKSNPDQKAGLLNQILGSLGPNVSQVLGGGGALAGLGGLLGGNRTVTPAQAEQVSPEAAQVLAAKASQTSPSIVDSVAGFYAQHPTLVKSIGVGALGLLMSRMSAPRR